MKKTKAKPFTGFLVSQRWLIINAACVLAFAGLALFLVSSLQQADYFTVGRVIIRENNDISAGANAFGYLKGKNIFAVDLGREAARIALSYPGYRKIRLTRFLPDCILVDFLRRIPVACIRGGKGWLVDAGCVLFDQSGSDVPALPSIIGLERKIAQPRLGRKAEIRELALSLEVLAAMKADKALDDYRVRSIDVSAPADLVCVIAMRQAQQPISQAPAKAPYGDEAADGVEVRLGSEGIPAKMQILATVLTQMRSNVDKIKYIDLRFKEPVIKLKDMEKFA